MHPGFFHHWKRAHACAGDERAAHAGEGGAHFGSGHGGSAFGVRRPLRVMSLELQLEPEQVERLARIIDDLKTERAQAAVDERRSVGLIAEALSGDDFDKEAAEQALALRVKSAERLRDAVLSALADSHAMLEPAQRKKLAYLLRSGAITI